MYAPLQYYILYATALYSICYSVGTQADELLIGTCNGGCNGQHDAWRILRHSDMALLHASVAGGYDGAAGTRTLTSGPAKRIYLSTHRRRLRVRGDGGTEGSHGRA